MTIPGTDSTVQFVFIDTILLAGVTDRVDRSLPPKGPASRTIADQQWAWISQTLQNSKADWIIVAGHYSGELSIFHFVTVLKINVVIFFCIQYGLLAIMGQLKSLLTD